MSWSLRVTRILQELAKFVIRYHEPVVQRDFKFMAGMLLALTVATAGAAGYAYVAATGQSCVTSASCDVWMAPAVGGPLKAPRPSEAPLTRLDTEVRSSRRG